MGRYGEFGDMFELANMIRENQEFHLDENESDWLKNDIKTFMEKYDLDDWDEAVSLYSTHNVLPEEKVRQALGESVNEQDDEPEEDSGMMDLGAEDEPSDSDEEMPEEEFAEDEFVEEEEVQIPIPEDKEYVGKSEDTHFYMVPEKNDQGEIIDMKIVDQEENQLFSAEENGIEPTDMSLFLNTVLRDSDVGISEIDRQVVVKYIIPAAEQEMVDNMDDEEDMGMGDDTFAGEEDEFGEDEFAEEDTEASEEDEFAEEDEGDFEEDEEMPKKKKKKDELLRPMESRLTENKIEFDGHEFDVQLVDESADATVISVNGKEFSYDPEFASLFHADGTLTESGVEELAKDALSNLGQDEFEALAEESVGEVKKTDESKETDMKKKAKKIKENYEYIDECEAYQRFDEYLDDADSEVNVMGLSFSPSRVMKQLDPVAYAEMFNNWLDGENLTIDPDEVEDDDDEFEDDEEDEFEDGEEDSMLDRNKDKYGGGHLKRDESKIKEEGEFKHVFLVKYTKDDGEEAEMRVEALDDNDAKMMIMKRRGVDKVTDVKKIAESKVVFPANSKYVKDGKDHFIISSEDQARKALERVDRYTSSPAWYGGKGLSSLRESVTRAVKKAYPTIKVTESKEQIKAPKKLDEAADPAFCLAQELLGLNESVEEVDEIKEGTEVAIMSKRDMMVIHECVKVAKVTEKGVEVTGNEAEMDQEWYNFDVCQIYPV